MLDTVCLILDSCCADHIEDLVLAHVELKFFPPNCMLLSQPLDRGIIRWKCFYRRWLQLDIQPEQSKNVFVSWDRGTVRVLEKDKQIIQDCFRKAGEATQKQVIENCLRKGGKAAPKQIIEYCFCKAGLQVATAAAALPDANVGSDSFPMLKNTEEQALHES